MKNFRLLFLLAAYFLMGSYAMAQPVMPTTSPADGSADVWYYVKFAERDWPLTSGASYMYDAGDGMMLIATQPAISDNLQWKIEETGTAGEYRIVSKKGNGIEFHPNYIGDLNLTEAINGDRYYTSATSTQRYVIQANRTNYFQMRRVNGGTVEGGIDKNNMRPYFDTWQNDVGNSVLFLPVATTTLTPPPASLVAYPIWLTDTPAQAAALQEVSNFNLKADPDNPLAKSDMFFVIGNGIPNATIAVNIEGEAASWFKLSKTLTTGSDGVLSAGVQVLFEPPAGTPDGTYSATLTLSAGTVSAKPITLNGAIVTFPFKLSSLDDKEEYWYYLNTPVRNVTGNLIIDNSTSETSAVITQVVGTKGDPKLLWKIVKDSPGNYWIINKATGNYINYGKAAGVTNKFSTGTDPRTFSFRIWTGKSPSNCWRLMCNGQDEVNKDTSGDRFGAWGASGGGAADAGNAIRFIAEDSPLADILFPQPDPELSSINNEIWYRIYFVRSEKVAQDVPGGELKQMFAADTPEQYWKLMGADNNAVTLESFAGNNCLWNAGAGRYYSSSDGNATTFQIVKNSRGIYWMLKDGSDYFEDSSELGAHIGRWNDANNFGAMLVFDKVPAICNVDASALNYNEVDVNKTKSLVVNVSILNTSATYAIGGTDASAFTVNSAATVWDAKRGGSISIKFAPTEGKAYSATLSITANGETKTVTLSGTGKATVDVITPADNDPVVSVKYYNLLGVEMTNPSLQGVYIVKNIHASGKTQVVKQLEVK